MHQSDDGPLLHAYDPSAFERPSIAVDLVLMGVRGERLVVLLGRRPQPPQAGRWALPGGFVAIDESLDDAATRVLRTKAGIATAHLEQLFTFGAVDRDPRMRIVSVAYLALLDETAMAGALAGGRVVAAAIDAADGREQDDAALSLAFDHAAIVALAAERLRGKIDYSDVAFALLPPVFTLRALQTVHEAVLGTRLNKPAFRRRMLDSGRLVATGRREADASHRPAELFRLAR